jgi:hypothetical protein
MEDRLRNGHMTVGLFSMAVLLPVSFQASLERIETMAIPRCQDYVIRVLPVLHRHHLIISESSTMGCQLYVKRNSHAASMTNKVSNSSAIRSTPHSSTASESPPPPGTPIEMHRRSEESQTRRRTLVEQPNHSMSFIEQHPAMAAE